jgi:PAS domain S-box-containing protein
LPDIERMGDVAVTGPADAEPGGRSFWSIRRLLIIGILSLEIATVATLVLATYLGAQNALSESYHALARQIARDAVTHAQDLLTNAAAAVTSTRNQIEDGALDIADRDRLALALFEALKNDPQLAGLYYGNAQGDFVYVMREVQGSDDLFRVKTIRIQNGQRTEGAMLRNGHWAIEGDLKPKPDDFLPNARPWYQKALEAGGDGWTAPYFFYTSARPGISFAHTVLSATGQIQGVVGGDIELDDITRFIAGLRVGAHGRAMIATRDAGILPSGILGGPNDAVPGRLTPVTPVTPTDDPALLKALGRINADAGAAIRPETYRFGSGGTRYFAVTAPFAAADLPWTLLITVPESDYLGWFYEAQRSTLIVGTIIGLVGIAIGLLLWRGLALPLERLRRNARAVQRGGWDDLHPTGSRLAEVRETEAAFLSMARFLNIEQTANQVMVRRLRKLAAAVEQSPAAVLITDSAGQIEYANPAFEELTRHPAGSVVGQPSFILARGPEDRPTYDEIVQCLTAGIVWRGEQQVRRADGTLFEASMVVAPVRNNAGLAANSVVIIEDITEARARERAIAGALDVAIAANQARAEFLAHMSHDLRTPLNAILGFSEVMSTELFGPLGDPRYRDYANDIWTSGEYLLRIVNQILEVAQAESANLTIADDRVRLTDLVETARRLLMDQMTARGIGITIEIPGDLVVTADATKLHQVIVNLLSNAVKFTPAGGGVAISIARPPAGGVELRIADTGIGMTEEEIDLALQPFIRVENNPMVRNNDGIGLGLPIAKRLIQLHGGRLSFDSVPGVGTIAIIWLPDDRVAGALL